MNDKREQLPFVSIIAPIYNMEDSIENLIISLLNQDYPKERLEIIIVDNNSTDNSKAIAEKFPILVFEEKKIQGSYAARNLGIKNAKGSILAFIDSDCKANKSWVREGVKKLRVRQIDLVGGKVEFYYSKRITPAELLDSLANMRNKVNIIGQNVAKTANLFVRKRVFDEIGLFPSYLKSGGDVVWTKRASQDGYLLIYASRAIVHHPARNLIQLLRKQYRVARGVGRELFQDKLSLFSIILNMGFTLFPSNFSLFKESVYINGSIQMRKRVFAMWVVELVINFSSFLGKLSSLRKTRKRGKK
ncbi:MAG: glycosyltransferase [Candidatus Hodarchaeota archaeon]